jgi:hypothetical protein
MNALFNGFPLKEPDLNRCQRMLQIFFDPQLVFMTIQG